MTTPPTNPEPDSIITDSTIIPPDAIAIPRARLLTALILSLIITLAATLLAVLTLTDNQQSRDLWLALPAIPIALLFAALSLVLLRLLTRLLTRP